LVIGVREGALAMTEQTNTRVARPQKPKDPPLPQRLSDEKLIETIERWANSSGLQKPT
jgi:hypothetical protein